MKLSLILLIASILVVATYVVYSNQANGVDYVKAIQPSGILNQIK